MDKSDELQELFSGELTPENRDRRLLALADHLDTCTERSSTELDDPVDDSIGQKKPPEFFTMETLCYSCGSPACLVGHGLALAGQPLLVPDATEFFSNIYGVSDDWATLLFAPSGKYNFCRGIGIEGHITSHHAASVIRHLVEIGVVDWDGIGQRLDADGTP